MYGLSEEDLQIQARARGFADELIPFEEEAERSGGELPADVIAAHAKRARELGLQATNMPKDLGGGGCTAAAPVTIWMTERFSGVPTITEAPPIDVAVPPSRQCNASF